MSEPAAPKQDFLFWIKAALPWAILHFGVVFVTAFITKGNAAAVGVATYIIVIVSGAVHYKMGMRDGLAEAGKGGGE